MQHRAVMKFYTTDGKQMQVPSNKIVEINTSNQMMFKQPALINEDVFTEMSREERFQQNAAIYNSRKQNLI